MYSENFQVFCKAVRPSSSFELHKSHTHLCLTFGLTFPVLVPIHLPHQSAFFNQIIGLVENRSTLGQPIPRIRLSSGGFHWRQWEMERLEELVEVELLDDLNENKGRSD